MVRTQELWFVVAGTEKARLMQGTTTREGSLHVDEVAMIATSFMPGEHQRPTRLSHPGSAADLGNEHEMALAHFARQLSPWLQKELTTRQIATCSLFAPSHLLGALRKQMSKDLAPRLRERDVDLIGLSPGQMAKHPEIKSLMVGLTAT